MKYLLPPLLLAAVLMSGCGSNKKNNPAPAASSSSIASSLSSSSTSSSSSTVISSSSLSSSSVSSSNMSSSSSAAAVPFKLTSTSFTSGAKIPTKFTCDGGETSPQLAWEIESSEVKSFALVMDDPDGIPIVGYAWVHWDVYNIPAATRQIPEGATASNKMPSGSIEGINNDDVTKYSGPCPPSGTGVHHYVLALYALNKETLNVDTRTALNRSAFESKYAKDIIQKVEITTQYGQ